MARYKNGVMGNFTGTVGTIVGSKWKGIDYMRSRSGKRTGAATQAQLVQQAKFKLMVSFLMPMKNLLMESCYDSKGTKTGYNNALGYNLRMAVTGDYPDFTVDYANAVISIGWLGKLLSPTVAVDNSSKITCSWTYFAAQQNGNADDAVLLLVYCPATNEAVYVKDTAVRSNGLATIDAVMFKSKQVQVYATCISKSGEYANSVHVGSLLVS